MVIEIRPCQTPEEVKQYDAMGAYVFASPEVGNPDVPTDADWTLCAFDDGKVVSQVGAFPFTVRLNGAPVSMAGVTMVGTLPAYRRQGLLRKLMTRSFEQMRERNQPLAILWASMGAIYQRFGYGIASDSVRYAFDPRVAGLQEPFEASGHVSLETPEEAYPVIKQLYVEWASPRNLAIHRGRALWQASTLHADEKDRPVYVGVYRDAEGTPRGHVVYQFKEEARLGHPGPNQLLKVKDFIALDLDAYKALWQYLLAHDLVGEVQMEGCVGPDDPAPDLLLEPRMLRKGVHDAIWMRVVDVEGAMVARPYGERGELTFSLSDPMCPWNDGTWLLETDGRTSAARKVERAAELCVTPNSLATLLAGCRTATHLARVGRLSGEAEVLSRADRLFRTEYAPHCPNGF